MSYTRDPDHYTRGVGAVQAVDKVLATHKARMRRMSDAAIESARRDRRKTKLMRLGLGALSVDTTHPLNTGSNTGSAASGGQSGGGTVKPPPARQFSAAKGAMISSSSGVLMTSAAPAAPGRPWLPTDPVCGPNQTGTYPNCIDNPNVVQTQSGTTVSGTVPVPLPPIIPDPTVIPTSTVGASSGGPIITPTTGGGVIVDPGPDVDSDGTVLVPTGPDYKTYALYAGGAIALFLLWRELRKGK